MAFQGAQPQQCLGVSFPSKQDIPFTFLAALPCALNRLALMYMFLLTAWRAASRAERKCRISDVFASFFTGNVFISPVFS